MPAADRLKIKAIRNVLAEYMKEPQPQFAADDIILIIDEIIEDQNIEMNYKFYMEQEFVDVEGIPGGGFPAGPISGEVEHQ